MSKSISFKQTMARALFVAEVFAVVGLYMFGTQGLYALRALNHDAAELQRAILEVADEIQKLESACAAWQNDPFFVEQCAREKLAMARDGEQIYVIK